MDSIRIQWNTFSTYQSLLGDFYSLLGYYNLVRSCRRQKDLISKQIQDYWTHCPTDLYIIPCRIIEMYISFSILWLDQNSSDLDTISPTSHPIIPWITYTHLQNSFHMKLEYIVHNKENTLPLYHILKIIPWVSLKAFPNNYNRTSLRYYYYVTVTQHCQLTVFTTSHTHEFSP